MADFIRALYNRRSGPEVELQSQLHEPCIALVPVLTTMHTNSRKILRWIVRDFNTRYHEMTSRLGEYSVSVIALADFSKSGMARSLSRSPALDESILDLQSGGYLKSSEAMYVSLTEKGFAEGSRGRFRRIWDFIDHSPGIAALVSFGAFIVSIIALLKK